MGTVYEKLGVRTIVNAAGTLTRLGGSRMGPEVVAAMAEAAGSLVRIDELQEAAGPRHRAAYRRRGGLRHQRRLGGLMLGMAACLTGLDLARMERLPDTRHIPNEVIIARSHRSGYDHALRAVGARLVEVGLPEPSPWEIEAAISPRTAAIAFSAGFSPLDLAAVCELAASARRAGARRRRGGAPPRVEPPRLHRRRAPTWSSSPAARRSAAPRRRASSAAAST